MYKERIAGLMKAVKNDDANRDSMADTLEFVESRMNTFTDYIGHVTWMETRIQRLNIEGVRGQEWQDAVKSLDMHRRSKHEVAMDALNQLNRLSTSYGLEPFYEGPIDHEHRNEVGDAIGDIVSEYFRDRALKQLKVDDLMDDEYFRKAVGGIQEMKGHEI